MAIGVLTSPAIVYAQGSFRVIHWFDWRGGATPQAGLLEGNDGALYGTTFQGGDSSSEDRFGTVFRLVPGRDFSVLHSFGEGSTNGASPLAGLVQDSAGALYGSTFFGGTLDRGMIFQINPDGTGFTNLHSFVDGEGGGPTGALIQASDGTLYGATIGMVFQMLPDGTAFTVLHTLSESTDGSGINGLIQAKDGTLYGTTTYGGGMGSEGTAFRMSPNGTGFTVLHRFVYRSPDGIYPHAGLILASDGTLNGTTTQGGAGDRGTVFQILPDGTGFSVLHSFTVGDGSGPFGGLIQASDGYLYGTTSEGGGFGRGTIFRLSL